MTLDALGQALVVLCDRVDDALLAALVESEDGAPVPQWQTDIEDAVDDARVVLAAESAP